jgi:hypothetical protein
MFFWKKVEWWRRSAFCGFAGVFEGCFEKSVFLVVAKSW